MAGLSIISVIILLAIFGPLMNSFGYRDIVQFRNENNKRVVARGIAPQIPALQQLFTGKAPEGNFAEYTFLFGTGRHGPGSVDPHLVRRPGQHSDRVCHHYH